jgi:hypothetical protein
MTQRKSSSLVTRNLADPTSTERRSLWPVFVFLFGPPSAAIEARREVLGFFGHVILQTSSLQEVALLAPAGALTLLIMSDSLSLEEAGRGLALVSTTCPGIRSLLLNSKSATNTVGILRGVMSALSSQES